MRVERIAAALAALAVAAAVMPGHHFLVGGGPLAETGRDLAAAAAQSVRAVGTLGAVDSGAPAAAAVFAVSVIVAAAIGVTRLAGPPTAEAGGERGRLAGPAIPAAALSGHFAGLIAAANREGGAFFYACTGGVAAAILLLAARGPEARMDHSQRSEHADHPGRVPGGPRAGGARLAGLLLLGAVLFLAAGAVDGILHAAARTKPLPEAWFVVAVEAGAGWARFPVLAVLASVAAAAWATERAADTRGGRGGEAVLLAAPAWALLLGPSNPARALAVAHAVGGLARAGVPAAARAGFAAALVLGMALLVHAV